MSQIHQRALSAHKPTTVTPKHRRRYEKVNTEASQGELSLGPKRKERESFYKRSRNMSKQWGKQPEELIQQNLNLKIFINSLQEQLSLERSRLQMNKKKNEKFARQISREFQKQLYYSGKNPQGYMISGVKSQYEHIKNLYEQKCSQLDSVLKTIEYTNLLQLTAYVEALEAQNSSLKNTLAEHAALQRSLTEISPQDHRVSENPPIYRSIRPSGAKTYTETSEDKSQSPNIQVQVLAGLLTEEKASLKRANVIIQQYSDKLELMSKDKQQFTKKLQFLERLVIEKDNNEHQARRELKRVEREKNQMHGELAKLQEQVKLSEAAFAKKLSRLQETQTKKYQIQKAIFDKTLLEKNQYIAKLEKEIRSLSTMLCYWKPLDQRNELGSQLSRHDIPNPRELEKEDKASSLRFNPYNDHQRRESIVSDHSYLAGESALRTDYEQEKSMRLNRQEEGSLRRTLTGNRSSSYQEVTIRERPRIECSKKYRETAQKTRKVDLNEIRELGELMRYRLIGHQVSMEQAKSYLDFKSEQNCEEFIKMKQIKIILQRHPFGLKEQEATLVSRYIIEDCANQYVYCDQENQNYRNIAKSILKAIIGEYIIPDLTRVTDEWQRIRHNYLPNIVAALKTIAPRGSVSFKKFSELLVGLGIEMSEELREWIVGGLVIGSESLQELLYSAIESI